MLCTILQGLMLFSKRASFPTSRGLEVRQSMSIEGGDKSLEGVSKVLIWVLDTYLGLSDEPQISSSLDRSPEISE